MVIEFYRVCTVDGARAKVGSVSRDVISTEAATKLAASLLCSLAMRKNRTSSRSLTIRGTLSIARPSGPAMSPKWIMTLARSASGRMKAGLYPPGLRENGGQYSHAAMWAILAFAKSGAGDRAHDLFSLLNPINHALAPEEAERYKVEHYVAAAAVYSVAPHVGRGGWTWYTGSAAWMYRSGIEGILGIRREGELLVVDPCIPLAWPGFEATVRVDATHYDIRVDNSIPRGSDAWSAVLDGEPSVFQNVRACSAGRTQTQPQFEVIRRLCA